MLLELCVLVKIFFIVRSERPSRERRPYHYYRLFIIVMHIIMSDQEELEVFLFSQSYMLKVFFFGQKELEVFLFHIVCKMLFFFI